MATGISKGAIDAVSVGQKPIVLATINNKIVFDKRPIYEFIIDQSTNVPENMISYLGANKDFTPAKMDYDKGSFDYGSWKNTWIVNAFRPCMLHADGTVAYYLNRNNLSQKADGSDATADLTDDSHDMNAMIEVDQIWIKEEEIDEDHFHISLSPVKATGFDCWTHYNINNKLVDKYYKAMYKGSLDSNNKMRSLKGKMPNASTAGNLQKEYCQANGAGWDCDEWSFRRLMQYVLFLLGKTTNTQSNFGQGFTAQSGDNETWTNSTVTNSGPTASGGHEDKGMFFGDNNGVEHLVVLGIEDFWGNVYDLCNGFLTEGEENLYIKMTPGTADGSTGTSYTDDINDYTPVPRPGGAEEFSKFIDKMALTPGKGLFFKTGNGTKSTGYCDYGHYETTHTWLRVGDRWDTGAHPGASFQWAYAPLSRAYAHYGASPSFKSPK